MIVMIGWWIYEPVLHGGWLWDDNFYLTQNPLIGDPSRWWKAWCLPGSFIEYYPVTETVRWMQWHLWGLNPFGYHVTNLVLHLISALLVWRLFAKLGLRLAWVGGLIFVLHPVQVESVAWIAELKNTLSLPPFLLAMCAWIDFERDHRDRDYFLALVFFLLAMLCKITAAPFPLVILLYAWWKHGRLEKTDFRTSAPFFLVSLVLGMTTLWTGTTFAQVHGMQDMTVPLGGFFSRVALAGQTLSFYLLKCFLPLGLLPLYPQWQVDPPTLAQFLPWPVLGGVMSWLWWQRKGWGRHALLGLGFFILMLLPFLGFNVISYMHYTWVMDHFLYIPIIGLIGLVVAALEKINLYLPLPGRISGGIVLAIALGLLALVSRGYAGIFVDQETLWAYTLQHNPKAWEREPTNLAIPPQPLTPITK